VTAALDALARLDDGLPVSATDRRLLAVFEEHCRWGQPIPCLICGARTGGPECGTCTADHDRAVARTADQ
jgi:hypothetical protein